jgi:hypothetical protein
VVGVGGPDEGAEEDRGIDRVRQSEGRVVE